MTWKIAARRYDIAGPLGGHLYFDIYNEKNERVWQIHGFATSENGSVEPVGFLDETIKVYTYPRTGGYNHPNDAYQILYTGSQASIENAMKDIFAAQIFINSQNLSYEIIPFPMLGFSKDNYNSNAIFKTLLNVFDRTLDIPAQNIQNAINLGGNNPGVNYDIFKEIKWERNSLDTSKPAGSNVEGTQYKDIISASEQGKSIIKGGADTDKLIGNGEQALLYGETGQDIFALANNSFIMDGTSEDFTTVAGMRIPGGIQQAWSESPYAYYSGFEGVVAGSPSPVAGILATIGTIINIPMAMTARYGMTKDGFLRIEMGRGKGGIAYVQDYDYLESTAGITVFRQLVTQSSISSHYYH